MRYITSRGNKYKDINFRVKSRTQVLNEEAKKKENNTTVTQDPELNNIIEEYMRRTKKS